MLNDWLEWNGTELALAPRTEAYARQFGLPWFKGCSSCGDNLRDALQSLLGTTYWKVYTSHTDYRDVLDSNPSYASLLEGPTLTLTTPQQDQPPWFDPDNADTWGFFGFYPLEIRGMDDSTRTATVTRKVGDGAVVGSVRYGPREVYVRGLLVGLDHSSVMIGLAWLRNLFKDDVCSPSPLCEGATLRFFSSCPTLCSTSPECVDDCATPYLRTLYDVTVTSGPTVLNEYQPNEGGLIEVEFTLTAGNPWVYGTHLPIVVNGAPYVKPRYGPFSPADFAEEFDIVSEGPSGTPLVSTWRRIETPEPEPVASVSCLVDPDCPPLARFPTLPVPVPGCGDSILPDSGTQRLVVSMKAEDVPQWARAYPVMAISAQAPHKAIRVRFVRQSYTTADSEFLVTWLPAGGTITLDATRDRVVLDCQGVMHSAEHLVVADTQGRPARWPVVSCGDSWDVLIDVPENEDPSDLVVDLSLVVRDI